MLNDKRKIRSIAVVHKKPIIYLWLFLCCFALEMSAYAQKKENRKTKSSNIHVIGRAQNQRILLRWIMTDPITWEYANQYGYMVERYTVLRNGRMYAGKDNAASIRVSKIQHNKDNPERDTVRRVLLTPVPLKPGPAEEWITFAQQDDNAAILAQALFGKPVINKDEKKNVASVLSKNEDLKQRFAFGLIAADRSFNAAQLAGLGLIDSTVEPGEKYLYRIYTAIPPDQLKTDTASIYIGLQDQQPLPVPKDLFIDTRDKTATLSWNFNLLKQVYNAYYVERSGDGKTFAKISDLPVVNLTQKLDKAAPAFYSDTLPQYNKPYYYRIVGVSSFGEEGPPSAVVKTIGKPSYAAVPNISTATVLSDKETEIEWSFDPDATSWVDHFELNHATRARGPFKVVNDKIAAEKRKINFTKLAVTNYFTITAVDKNGKQTTSFPYLVQPVDSIAPAPPAGLTGAIDSTGMLTLRWKANKEPDVMGYQVLKRNLDGEALMIATPKPFAQTIFTEKVNMESLNQEVQYAVVALDKRANQSEPSRVIKVQKPDKIAPAAPLFSDYKIAKDKVILQWIPSSSKDATIHKVYRKEVQNKRKGDWSLVKEINDRALTSCTDYIEPGKTYAYLLIAVDKSNNESPASNALTLTVPPVLLKPAINHIQAEANRDERQIKIAWKYDERGIVEQEIYKAAGGTPVSLWKVVAADQRAITDKDIAPGNVYKYAVRAIFKDGGISSWREVSVQY